MARHPTGDQAWAGISGLWRCVSFRFRPSPSANSSRSRCLAEQAVRGESPLLFLDQCAGYQGKRGQPHFLRRQVRNEQFASQVVEAGGVEPIWNAAKSQHTDLYRSYTSQYRQSSRSTLQRSSKLAVAFHLIKQSLVENGFRLNGTSIPEQAQQRWNAPPQRTQAPESLRPAPVGHATPATATAFTTPLFAGSALPDLPRRRTHRHHAFVRGLKAANSFTSARVLPTAWNPRWKPGRSISDSAVHWKPPLSLMRRNLNFLMSIKTPHRSTYLHLARIAEAHKDPGRSFRAR